MSSPLRKSSTPASPAGGSPRDSGSREALVVFSYKADKEKIVHILASKESWSKGKNAQGNVGLFPTQYVVDLDSVQVAHCVESYDPPESAEHRLTLRPGDKVYVVDVPGASSNQDWLQGIISGESMLGRFPASAVQVSTEDTASDVLSPRRRGALDAQSTRSLLASATSHMPASVSATTPTRGSGLRQSTQPSSAPAVVVQVSDNSADSAVIDNDEDAGESVAASKGSAVKKGKKLAPSKAAAAKFAAAREARKQSLEEGTEETADYDATNAAEVAVSAMAEAAKAVAAGQRRVVAEFDFAAESPGQLLLEEGDIVVVEKEHAGWMWGRRVKDGQFGRFPANFTLPEADAISLLAELAVEQARENRRALKEKEDGMISSASTRKKKPRKKKANKPAMPLDGSSSSSPSSGAVPGVNLNPLKTQSAGDTLSRSGSKSARKSRGSRLGTPSASPQGPLSARTTPSEKSLQLSSPQVPGAQGDDDLPVNTLRVVVATFEFKVTAPGQMPLRIGDRIAVTSEKAGWAWGTRLSDRRRGRFPSNYVETEGDNDIRHQEQLAAVVEFIREQRILLALSATESLPEEVRTEAREIAGPELAEQAFDEDEKAVSQAQLHQADDSSASGSTSAASAGTLARGASKRGSRVGSNAAENKSPVKSKARSKRGSRVSSRAGSRATSDDERSGGHSQDASGSVHSVAEETGADDDGKRVVIALYDFEATTSGQLSMSAGDRLVVTGEREGWFWGYRLSDSRKGRFPANFVQFEDADGQELVKETSKRIERQISQRNGAGDEEADDAGPLKRVVALFDFAPSAGGQLEFQAGTRIDIEKERLGWCWGCVVRTGERGRFPANYVRELREDEDPNVDQADAATRQGLNGEGGGREDDDDDDEGSDDATLAGTGAQADVLRSMIGMTPAESERLKIQQHKNDKETNWILNMFGGKKKEQRAKEQSSVRSASQAAEDAERKASNRASIMLATSTPNKRLVKTEGGPTWICDECGKNEAEWEDAATKVTLCDPCNTKRAPKEDPALAQMRSKLKELTDREIAWKQEEERLRAKLRLAQQTVKRERAMRKKAEKQLAAAKKRQATSTALVEAKLTLAEQEAEEKRLELEEQNRKLLEEQKELKAAASTTGRPNHAQPMSVSDARARFNQPSAAGSGGGGGVTAGGVKKWAPVQTKPVVRVGAAAAPPQEQQQTEMRADTRQALAVAENRKAEIKNELASMREANQDRDLRKKSVPELQSMLIESLEQLPEDRREPTATAFSVLMPLFDLLGYTSVWKLIAMVALSQNKVHPALIRELAAVAELSIEESISPLDSPDGILNMVLRESLARGSDYNFAGRLDEVLVEKRSRRTGKAEELCRNIIYEK